MVFSVITILIGLVGIATGLGRLARAHWVCELAAHFRLQYACVAFGCAAAFLVGQQWGLMVAAAALALINLQGIGRLYHRHVSAASSETALLRVLIANVQHCNRQMEGLRRLVEAEQPDIIVLIELTEWWVEALGWLTAWYPQAKQLGLRNGWGIGFFSRLPVEQIEALDVGGAELPSLVARLKLKGQPVTFIGTHPYAPVTMTKARLRNQQLRAIASYARAQEGALIVVGDLNVTAWSPHFQDLLHASGLRDSQEGFGLQWTWPTLAPWLGVAIDHCLVSPQICVADRRVGPPIGSDHLPILVDLWLEPSRTRLAGVSAAETTS